MRWTNTQDHPNFNPRSHERSDAYFCTCFAMSSIFQSTLPREERRQLQIRCRHPFRYFNPRSHERSDASPQFRRFHLSYFNPRSHERSDRFGFRCILAIKISIHAPTRGATCFSFRIRFCVLISIHAPTRGATQN